MNLTQAIDHVARGHDLSADDIAEAFSAIMAGDASGAQIGGLLVGLRVKGETAAEITGAARAMRERAASFVCPDPERAVDTCGTGGDGAGTVNISTLAAIVSAACGVIVAKHGNRALSSRAGSADLLEALGVAIAGPAEAAERCLREIGIAFLFAPAYHAATRHANGPRRELGTRTIFNLLGPLTNPAGVKNQVIGVFDGAWCEPVARALGNLGSRRVFVLHGAGGVDEIAVRGQTQVAEYSRAVGQVQSRTLSPADFGQDEHDPADLAGGSAEDNARIARALLDGKKVPDAIRSAVIMEAALAVVAAGPEGEADFLAAAGQAASALDSGAASRLLSRWVELSNA
ncbi:MAG TPA: anthranilate phosphoribosyltransferase [Kofleriaceae bacterium]|nr:anthranilate phosphoribosyltransferase [Kofleriaceae bacterium]